MLVIWALLDMPCLTLTTYDLVLDLEPGKVTSFAVSYC